MSRTISWGVAAGATLLISLTACAQPASGNAIAAGGPENVCSLVGTQVSAQLLQAGITATPTNNGSSSGCTWQDQASATTVTLTTGNVGGKDGQAVETTTVPGAGTVQIVGPGEVTFTAANRPWDLKVDSKNSDQVDTKTATALVVTISQTLGGGGATAGATAAPTGAASSAVNTATESTTTVTDINDRTFDLRTSTISTGQGSADALDLGNGQTVPMKTIARIVFSDAGRGDTFMDITTIDGKQAHGGAFGNHVIQGESDFGPFSQEVKSLKTVEFHRDVAFVATPDPTTLTPFDSAIATVVQTSGEKSAVKAPTLTFSGDGITLENGLTVQFRRIATVESVPVTDGQKLTITLVNGTTVAGTVNKDLTFTGDADTGPLAATAGAVQSITINRR
jgi:hypothetical protein